MLAWWVKRDREELGITKLPSRLMSGVRSIPTANFHVADESIPTTGVGINNTERGHCAKTLRILKLALSRISKNFRHVRWVVLTDDDTILGFVKIMYFLVENTNSIRFGGYFPSCQN